MFSPQVCTHRIASHALPVISVCQFRVPSRKLSRTFAITTRVSRSLRMFAVLARTANEQRRGIDGPKSCLGHVGVGSWGQGAEARECEWNPVESGGIRWNPGTS